MTFRSAFRIGGAESVVVSGSGTLTSLGDELKGMGFAGRAAVIADINVPASIVESAERSLDAAGFEAHRLRAELSERHKDLATVGKIYEWLAQVGLERRECVVAIGGGVAGDLAGFAAATWLRGVALALVPTTLAAMVDASIGGKVGVNTEHGKNMVGAFHPARLVLQDTDALATLDDRHWLSGIAEALKHGLILDEPLLEFMEQNSAALLERDRAAADRIIQRSIELKGGVVGQDARETAGQRALLNYGHTVGHALEALAGYGEVSHGEAIAVGMAVAGAIARAEGMLTEEQLERQRAALSLYGLPLSISGYSAEDVLEAARRDKKVRSRKLVWVLLDGIGSAVTRADVPESLALEAIRSAVAPSA